MGLSPCRKETVMEMILKLPKKIEQWSERMVSAGAPFVRLETVKAVWDRCAVVENNERNITVEYPRSKGEGSRMEWVIRRDIVPRREVVSMRKYTS